MSNTLNKEFTLMFKFTSFNKQVKINFNDTVENINDCQMKNYEGLVARQEDLVPEILQKIFEYYKKTYPHYYKGWSYGNQLTKEQIEEDLPTPTNAMNLKKFIEPLSVYIANKKQCEEGTLGIYFDCTWDIKNCIGVVIKKWKVAYAGPGEIAFLF